MDSDDQFWARIWLITAGSILGLVLMGVTNNIVEDQLKTRMVLEGASPLEANCALASTGTQSTICVILATKGGE